MSWLRTVALLGLLLYFGPRGNSVILAQHGKSYVREVRVIGADELGLVHPSGLAFSPEANVFLVMEAGTTTLPNLAVITPFGDLVRKIPVDTSAIDPANLAFDIRFNRLLLSGRASRGLIAMEAQPDGHFAPATMALTRLQEEQLDLQEIRGMAVDLATGHIFFLDGSGPQIVHVERSTGQDLNSSAGSDGDRISRIRLKHPGLVAPRGLAFSQANGHLYLMTPASQTVYELTPAGQIVASLDLAPFGFVDPRSLVFAPSGDPTDDPSIEHLYIADTGPGAGRIVELSFSPHPEPTASVPTIQVTLERTTWTSEFTPPSPDPAGLAYLPGFGTLLMVDSEVDEMPQYFTGDNLFEMSLQGGLVDTLTTLPFTYEPTGIAYDPASQDLFFSDDNPNIVFELDPGPDGLYNTMDDTLTQFSTRAYGSMDPEGIAFDSSRGHLFIVDGLAEEVYEISPGANRVFDGVPPSGDDQVSQFDVAALGLADPKGIEFDPDSGHLYIVSGRKHIIGETTTDGTIIGYLDLASVNSYIVSGLAYAPSSTNPARMNLYLVDRGVDNDFDPEENDGRLYEISFNRRPVVDIAPAHFVVLPDGAVLDGTVADDGLPDPPGEVTPLWSQASGPGTVFFADASALNTTATFSRPGTYTLRLTADDGELSASEETRVVVIEESGEVTALWLPVVTRTVAATETFPGHRGFGEQQP